MIWHFMSAVWGGKNNFFKECKYKMAVSFSSDEEDDSLSLHGFGNSESSCPLLRGYSDDIRRPSDPFALQKEGKHHPGNLQSLTTVSIDSLSVGDGKYPPLSPGYLSISGNESYFPPPSPGLLSTNSAWSELAKIHSRRSSYGDFNENSSRATSRTWSNVSSSLSEHLHNLVRAFSSRTEKVKEATVQPPTPSSLSEDFDCNSDVNSAYSGLDEPPQRERRLGSFIPGHSSNIPLEDNEEKFYLDWGCCKSRAPRWCKHLQIPSTLEAQSKIYMSWLFLVTLTFMYNAWVIPLRGTFHYQTESNLVYWLICDYVSDFIYILDVLLIKPRLRYLESGIMVTDTKLTRKNYTKKLMFKFDLLSLLPLDLLYLVVGVIPWLRFPRILKIQTFWEFYEKCDQAVRSAHVLRIIKTMTYMMYLIHIETCGYYFVSWYEGFESNRWVYNGKGIAYIRCFYLATKTATSIGNNPKPTNVLEYVFMVIYWLSGVFVFALLIGQIRDIAEAAGRVKTLYNKRMDAALWYVKNLNLPKETQDRVRTWFIYNWEQTKILDEKALMDWLPKNLRTDLAYTCTFSDPE
ncbi:hypothetical protein KUTeg_019876 [Tegillarca granosa]|uniref:Ion transport domain-containing protein n=1 Tax=Tegillarca granosa TaxID=220873 RepID=A0ABQ9EJA5_TEGGR|nr:hypothetical protein KUTeg_019876 [Tegillarca granosa]